MKYIEKEFYLSLELKDRRYPSRGINVPKATAGKPTIGRGAIAVKLKLKIPVSAFEEFIPEGELVIPEDANLGRPAINVHVPEDIQVTEGVRLFLVPFTEEEEAAAQSILDNPSVVGAPRAEGAPDA